MIIERTGSLFSAVPICVSLLSIFATVAFGQTNQGGLRGLVTDASNAPVPGAKVVITDEAKLTSRTAISDGAGQYVFSALEPASYKVEVAVTGFKRFARPGIAVDANAIPTVDVKLEVGDTTQTVEVTASAPILNTADASNSTTLPDDQLDELPSQATDGRSIFTMANISTNIEGGTGAVGFSDQTNISLSSVAGAPEATNQYIVDGVPITDTTSRPAYVPSLEATQEVKVQTSTYSADMGRTAGGVWNVVLKSGTNALHGSLFGVTRQPDWAANSWFNNRNGVARPVTPFYNWAGSLSGPVVIPHLYNGKNKTFWFVAEEGYRQRGGTGGSQYSLPTPLEAAGNFSQSLTSAGKLNVIYDPTTTTVVNGVITRTPFTNNSIPASRISPVGAAIVGAYPAAQVTPSAAGGIDFTTVAGQGWLTRADQFVSKVDEQIKPWWSMNASYVHFGNVIPLYNALPSEGAAGQIYYRKVDSTNVASTFVINPTTVVAVRFGFNRFPNQVLPQTVGFNPTTLGFPNYGYQYSFFPDISLSGLGYSGLGENNAYIANFYSRNLITSVSKYLGRHSLTVGFDYRVLYMNYIDLGNAAGTYVFNGTFTQANPTTAASGTGDAIADLLLGLPASGMLERSQDFKNSVNYYGTYIQDDFRVSKTLTLNFGLRYEYETGLLEANNANVLGFNPTEPSPLSAAKAGTVGGLEFATPQNRACCNLSDVKFAPRIGFAYSVTPKTVIRGGFGTFYAPVRYDPTAALQTGFTTETPLVSSNNGGLNPSPTFSFSNPFPGGAGALTGSSLGALTGVGTPIAAYAANMVSPIVQSFSVDVQRQLPFNMVLDVAYVGSRSHDLVPAPEGGGATASGGGKTNIDQLNPQYFSLGSAYLNTAVANPYYGNGGSGTIGNATVSNEQLLLPFPQFTSVNLLGSFSKARYNSMTAKVEKRLSAGLVFQTGYTYSRNKDSAYATGSNGLQNVYNIAAEYSLSSINQPSRWVTALTYQLPFGKGKKFLTNHWADLIVGGWAIGDITTIQSGFSLAVSQTNLNAGFGTAAQRPNATGSVVQTTGSVESRLNGYINAAAFASVPEYQFGNIARELPDRAPLYFDMDATITKSWKFERATFTFRAESEGVTNTPTFGAPNTTLGNANFGKITSASNSRVIKLGGRIVF